MEKTAWFPYFTNAITDSNVGCGAVCCCNCGTDINLNNFHTINKPTENVYVFQSLLSS